MAGLKKIPEIEREKSSLELERRDPLPKKQERPTSTVKMSADMKDLESLVEFTKKTIEDISKSSKSRATGDAILIKTEQVVIDPRVRWKCVIPLCFGYDSSPCCPPHSPTHEDMKEIVSSYKHAILLKYMPKPKNHVYPGFLSGSIQHVNELNEIVSIVETEACYNGFYLAMGFKGGPCGCCGRFSPEAVSDWVMGKKIPRCPVLDGDLCSQYLRPRPALEACGVDVFATAKNVGWEIPYIIMPEHPKTSIPSVSWHGLVLII